MKEIRIDTEPAVIWRNPDSVFKYNGWPSVCCDERGVLYATASGFRIQHVDPSGKNVMFVSPDGGHKWSRPIILNDSYLDDRDTGIISLGGGHMIATWFSERTDDSYPKNPGFPSLHKFDQAMILGMMDVYQYLPQDKLRPGAYVITSDDYGLTWTKPERVPMTAPHGPNRMNDGRAVYLGKDMHPDETGECKVYCYISGDYGRTWDRVGAVPLPEHEGLTWQHLHEPHVVQLPSGRLIGAIRVHCRKVEPVDTVYTTYSDDEGKTWSMPECVGVSGLPPHLLVHSSGAVILSYSCRVDGQRAERACVSYDGGETWAQDYVISDNVPFCDHGYPATAECSDGSLFTVYYQCYPGDDFCSVLGNKWKLEK